MPLVESRRRFRAFGHDRRDRCPGGSIFFRFWERLANRVCDESRSRLPVTLSCGYVARDISARKRFRQPSARDRLILHDQAVGFGLAEREVRVLDEPGRVVEHVDQVEVADMDATVALRRALDGALGSRLGKKPRAFTWPGTSAMRSGRSGQLSRDPRHG